MNWYAAYTFPRHEKRVDEYLQLVGIESFLPTYKIPREWKNGLRVETEFPLFPSYVFARFDMRDRVRVLESRGVLDIVSVRGTPVPLPELEIQILKAGLGKTGVLPHPFIKIGDRVRLKSGPLLGLEGVLIRVKACWRLIVCVDMLMQAISIEVDCADVERLCPTQPNAHCVPRIMGTPACSS
jgi:transcription antitermination factor NusG